MVTGAHALSLSDINQLVSRFNAQQYEMLVPEAQDFIQVFPEQGLAWQLLGTAQLLLGKYSEGIFSLQKAAQLLPQQPQIQHSLGFGFDRIGQLDKAVAYYREALALQKDDPKIHNVLGNALAKLGESQEALKHYEQALILEPSYVDVLSNRGNVLMQLERYEEAEQSYRHALQFNPTFAEAHYNLGSLFFKLERFQESEHHVRQAIEAKAGYMDAVRLFCTLLIDQQRYAEAKACLQMLLGHPSFSAHQAELFYQLGNVQNAESLFEEAEQSFRQAIELDANHFYAHNNLGNALYQQEKWAEAEASYRQTLTLKAGDIEALANLAQTLDKLGDIEQAAQIHQDILQRVPEHRNAALQLAHIFLRQDKIEAAKQLFIKVLAQKPDDAETQFNLSRTQLILGEIGPGWKNHEARLRIDNFPFKYQSVAPQWQGEPVSDKASLVIYPEQGAGDLLYFSRFFPELKRRFARVRFAAYPPLVRLFQESFPDIEILDSHKALNQSDFDAGFDYGCPMMSLAALLGIDHADKIPQAMPYLKVLPEWKAQWQGWLEQQQLVQNKQKKFSLGKARKPLLIGLVWSGQVDTFYAKKRDIPIEFLKPLLAYRDCHWISLQFPSQPQTMETFAEFKVNDPMTQVKDFADTAGLVSLLDLVIAADTSVAHLAGALGKPVWLINRFNGDCRWIKGKTDSPWYPSMRIFTQPKEEEWAPVIAQVLQALIAKK